MTALIEALRVNETELKNAAIEAITQFGRAAVPAVPTVVRIMNEANVTKNDRLVISSAEMVLKIGSRDEAAGAIGALREVAERGNSYMRDVATRILKDLKAAG